METVTNFIFLGSKITVDCDCSHEIKRCLLFVGKAMTKLDSILKSRDITLLTKVHLVKAIFSSSHVQMWELDHKDGLVLKNWCFWTVVLEKTTESPLDCKEIKPVNPKENQSWIFIGRTDAEAEAPILWPPDGTANLLEKLLMLRKIDSKRRRRQQRMRWLNGSLTQWTWIWANTRRQWTGKPGVLQSMELQRVRYDWATEQQGTWRQ